VPPSGLVAGAPLVLSLPWLARLLHEQGRLERATAVLLAGAASTSSTTTRSVWSTSRSQRSAEAGWHRDTPVTGEAYSGRRDSG
jgi:hypothetical protein